MSRRVFDEVTVNALSKTGGSSIREHYENEIGASSLVKPIKNMSAKLKKADMPLYPFTLRRVIRSISKSYKTEEGDCFVKTSRGVLHQVSPEAIQILKAIYFEHAMCNPELQDCLANVLIEIGDFFTFGKFRGVINLDDYGAMVKESKLMAYCRSEVFALLTEAGVPLCQSVKSK